MGPRVGEAEPERVSGGGRKLNLIRGTPNAGLGHRVLQDGDYGITGVGGGGRCGWRHKLPVMLI
eukprot:scaffold27522_cov56-Isochrysis_galbana.AAC.1